MTEENKQKEVPVETTEIASAKSAKSGMTKYFLYGGAGLVLTLLIAVVAGFLMKETPSSATGEGSPIVAANAEAAKVAQQGNSEDNPAADNGEADSLAMSEEFSLDDTSGSATEKIMDNLAFLDYEPNAEEAVAEDSIAGVGVEDSLKQVDWLAQEKTALAAREKELTNRQNELEKLEKQVNQKILKIEQAESARVAQLAKLYDGMEARAVAALLANLDDETVVSILPRMKAQNASAVLQLMPAQRAAKLSKQMITIAEK